MKCPQCNEECDQDEVDVGVGIIYGPPRCNYCGWYEGHEIDSIIDSEMDNILKEAQKTVQPITDKEKMGESIQQDLMEFRVD